MSKSRKEMMRKRRRARIRKKIYGTSERPRLSVFRSLRYIYAQVIDDERGHTLVHISSRSKEFIKEGEKISKVEKAKRVGEVLAKKCLEKNIKKVVFDRGGYLYHGRVSALAEGARKGGLEF
jgi:large subunit ribosomal protein L18